MFDNLISSDRKKKHRSWNPWSVIGALIIVAGVIVGAVYVSTGQKKKKQKKQKKVVKFMDIKKVPKQQKPKPKPKHKKPAPKPKAPKPTPKSKAHPKPHGTQTLHKVTHISNKIPPVNLNAQAVKAANFSGEGTLGGTANGYGSPNGKKGASGTGGHGGLHKVFHAVGHMPKLKGGYPALAKKVNYPQSCKSAGIQGRVTVAFIVNKKGIPTHVHVTRGIGGGCDRAAVEAVKKYARFTPGMQRHTPVRVQMSLPIVFRLKY